MIASQLTGPKTTVVTYPRGSLQEDATVVYVAPDPRHEAGQQLLVITDVTPFHPLDPLWPDQPADHGMLLAGGRGYPVHDTLTVARRSDRPLMVDDAVDARRDEPDVTFLVAHVVDAMTTPHPAVGEQVALAVDGVRRLRLSAAHTACHLLAYALNEATHTLWRKPAATDSRGNHDFDEVTCVHTQHDVDGSTDRYRLGKSLRKRGFDSGRFLDELPAIIDRVNATLAEWIASDASVRVECAGSTLTSRRQWICETPNGIAAMPCGGTHVQRLSEIESMTAAAVFDVAAGVLTIGNEVHTAS